MAGGLWVLAKCSAISLVSAEHGGRAIIAAQALSRASSAPLVYFCDYIVDDDDAKGEYYNWFADSKRLLGPLRVALSCALSCVLAFALLPAQHAQIALGTTAMCTLIAGAYGNSVLGGVMGDFLGASICMIELAVYLALAVDPAAIEARGGWARAQSAFTWLAIVVSMPQIHGAIRRRLDPPIQLDAQEC